MKFAQALHLLPGLDGMGLDVADKGDCGIRIQTTGDPVSGGHRAGAAHSSLTVDIGFAADWKPFDKTEELDELRNARRLTNPS